MNLITAMLPSWPLIPSACYNGMIIIVR
jgi:hypothetical protein